MTDNPTPTNSTLRELAEAAIDSLVARSLLAEALKPKRILAILDERDKLAGERDALQGESKMWADARDLLSDENASLRTQLSEVTAERDAAYEALRFYADRESYHGGIHVPVDADYGERARKALEAAQLIQSKEGA